jgi:hypothetical protein
MSVSWNQIPSAAEIAKAVDLMKQRGFEVIVAKDKSEALELIKAMIPQGSSVMNGSSTTLHQIGFTDYLKEKTGWINLHEVILAETDPLKQRKLRRQAILADYFLGSVNAITTAGQLISVDRTGSRVGAYPFAAGNLILVAGVNKFVRNLEEAFARVAKYVLPMEDQRMKSVYGPEMSTGLGKWVIIEHEVVPGRIKLILIKEKLGF